MVEYLWVPVLYNILVQEKLKKRLVWLEQAEAHKK